MIVSCPNCRTIATIGDSEAGKPFTCPNCQQPFHVDTPTAGQSTGDQAAESALTVCGECGTATPLSELADFGGIRVCARCKPIYVQKLKEGIATTGRFQYGGFWARALAVSIDGLIGGVAGGLIGAGIVVVSAQAGAQSAGGIVAQVLNMVVGVTYSTWFIGRFGATPGKMALGLKVVKPDGSGLTYPQAFGRYWANILSGLTLGIGYIMAAFDEERRTLHDRICATRVVKA